MVDAGAPISYRGTGEIFAIRGQSPGAAVGSGRGDFFATMADANRARRSGFRMSFFAYFNESVNVK